jgi:hypothetical protein
MLRRIMARLDATKETQSRVTSPIVDEDSDEE